MRNTRLISTGFALLLVVFIGVAARPESGTLFFRGQVIGTEYGTLQSGIYSMRFAIFDAETGGRHIWPQLVEYEEHPLVIVSGGVFDVELGSMGQPVLDLPEGEAGYYVQVWVCQPAGFECSGFELLPTRLPLTGPTYSFIGTPMPGESSQEENDRQASTTSSGGASDAWLLHGNAGTSAAVNFLGTTDNVDLTLRVNNQPALRLEADPVSPNLIGGHHLNSVLPGVFGATIGGGGDENHTNRVMKEYGSIGGGTANHILGQYGTVAGGYWNEAADYGFIGGGQQNSTTTWFAAVSGGYKNTASGNAATVAGGRDNSASGMSAAVGGGFANSAAGAYAFAAGGRGNSASGDYSFAAGYWAGALHEGSFVWADGLGIPFESTDRYQFLVRATGGALFNFGTSHTGMIVSSGSSDLSSSALTVAAYIPHFSLLVLNERESAQLDVVSVWGHAGGVETVRRGWSFGEGANHYGVLGTAVSGYGVVGIISGAADDLAAGRFIAERYSGKTFAVHGTNRSDTEGSAGGFFTGDVGVMAEANDPSGTAILARVPTDPFGDASGYGVYAEGGAVGVYGQPRSTAAAHSSPTYGVYGKCTTNGYGVYGESTHPTGYGVYSEGNSHVDGKLTWKPFISYVSVGPIDFAATAIDPFTLGSRRDWKPVTGSPRYDCGRSIRDYDPTARELYFASLQLPHGVELRTLEFHYSYAGGSDGTLTSDSYLRLARSDLSGKVTFLAEIQTKVGGLSSAINHVVDNSTGFYYLAVGLDCLTTLHGVVISYEVSTPY